MHRRIQNHAHADIKRQLSLAGQGVKEANAIYRRGGAPQALDMLQRLLFRMGALNAIATDSTVSSGSSDWLKAQGAQSAVGDAIDKMRRTAGVDAPRESFYKRPGTKVKGALKREVRLQSRVANPSDGGLDYPVAVFVDPKAQGLWVDEWNRPRHPLNANFTIYGPFQDGKPHPKAVVAQARIARLVAEHQAHSGSSKPSDAAVQALANALLKAGASGTTSQVERFAKKALRSAPKQNPASLFDYDDVNKYLKAVKAEQKKALRGVKLVWTAGDRGGVKTWTAVSRGVTVTIYAPYGVWDYQVYAAQGQSHGAHYANAKSLAEAKRLAVEAVGYYAGIAPNAMGRMKTNPRLAVKAGHFDAPARHRSGWGYYVLIQRRPDGALDKSASFYAPDDSAARAYAPKVTYDGARPIRLERALPYDAERSHAAWNRKYRSAR